MKKGYNPVLYWEYLRRIWLRRHYIDCYMQLFPVRLEGGRIHYSVTEGKQYQDLQRYFWRGHHCKVYFIWMTPILFTLRAPQQATLHQKPATWALSANCFPSDTQICPAFAVTFKTSWHKQGDIGTTAKGWHYTWELSNVPICSLGPANTCSYGKKAVGYIWVCLHEGDVAQ